MPCSLCNNIGHNRRTCKKEKEESITCQKKKEESITCQKEECKKVKGSITSRISTLNYEFEKSVICNIKQKSYKIFNDEEINTMMITPVCVYCGEKGKINSDHFVSVISKNKTNIYNDFANCKVPCCNKCNSSKGNKDWRDYILIKKDIEGYEDRYKLLEKLESLIMKHKTEYEIDVKDKEMKERLFNEMMEQLSKLQLFASKVVLKEYKK